MRILFDNGTPKLIWRSLPEHQVTFVRQIGWHQLENGELIQRAEDAGFDVLLSTAKNIQIPAKPQSQKNCAGRSREFPLASRATTSR